MSAYTLLTQEGIQLFHNVKNTFINIFFGSYDFIIIIIIYGHHFTIVFLNTKLKQFTYLDPLKNNTVDMTDTDKLFKVFPKKWTQENGQ